MTETDEKTNSPLGVFGDYVATRELPAEPGIVIYRARKKDAPATEQYRRDHPLVAKHERFVIKLRPGLAIPETAPIDDSTATELAEDPCHNFLKAISTQKKASDGGARHVAPVHMSQRGPEGAWYVTDYYGRGLFGSWVEMLSGVQNADELHHLISTIVQGLLEFKKHCGRSHGGLNPRNILVGGKDQSLVRRTLLFLTDPLMGTEADAAAFERTDLRALGEILYRLVVCHGENRRFNPDNYPLDFSVEWEKLGVQGKDWLEICNQLLDPNLSLDRISLETLQARLKRLQPKSAIPPWVPYAALAAVMVAGASFLLLWRHSSPVAYRQNVEAIAGTPRAIVLTGHDPQGRPLSFAIVDGPKQGDLDQRALPTVRYTPGPNFSGSDRFSFTVGSGDHKSRRALVVITVKALPPLNQPPAADPQLVNAIAGSPAAITLIGRDPERKPLTYQVAARPRQGDLTLTGSQAVYTAKPTYEGLDEFSFTVNDGQTNSPSAKVTITVRKRPPANQPPTADSGKVEAIAGVGKEVVLRGRDPEGKPLTFQIIGPPKLGVLTGTGPALIYTAKTNAAGPDRFTFKVNDGEIDSPPAVVEITVLANRPPVISPIQAQTIGQNKSLGPISFTVWDDHIPADKLVVEGSSTDSILVPWQNIILAGAGSNRTVTITPAPNRSGTVKIFLALSDTIFPVVTEFVLTVKSNSPPFLSPLPNQTNEVTKSIGPLAFTVGDNETAVDQLAVTASSSDQTLAPDRNLRVTGTGANRSLTIAPGPSKPGVANIFLVADDGALRATNSFRLTVIPAPAPPPPTNPPTPPIRPSTTTTSQVATPIPSPLPVRTMRTNSIGLELVWVADLPAGAPWSGINGSGGWVGKYEVIQGEFELLMGAGGNPSTQKGNPRFPVENVSWNESTAFCARLTEKERASLPAGWHYALPTGAQWDYFVADAAIADSVTSMAPSPKRLQPEPVGSTGKSNKWGLFDVRGNVWEWSLDSPVYRGGSYTSVGEGVFGGLGLSTRRSGNSKDAKDGTGGFRVVLVPGAP